MRIKEQRKRKKRRRIGICIFLVVLMLFALAALIVVKVFTVQNVVVEGNSLYSADQIKNMVLDDDYSWNSLYVDLKYRFVDVGEVPFVDTMEISLDDPHTLRISVTEKGILGSFYIDTLGQYAYFDKDGFVVETSSDVIEGVPKITGVTCDSVVLYEKLPLEDTKLLRNLLTLTQLLKKYELEPEEIHYDSAMQPHAHLRNDCGQCWFRRLSDTENCETFRNYATVVGTLRYTAFRDMDAGYDRYCV